MPTFLFSSIVYAQGIKDWGECVVDGVPTLSCLEVVFGNLIFMASAFVVFVLFIMFVVGGLRYLTSMGNPEGVKKAQGTLRFAVIGLILFLSSFLILKTIDILFLGGQGRILKFEIGCRNQGAVCDPNGAGCCTGRCDDGQSPPVCVAQ